MESLIYVQLHSFLRSKYYITIVGMLCRYIVMNLLYYNSPHKSNKIIHNYYVEFCTSFLNAKEPRTTYHHACIAFSASGSECTRSERTG